MTFSFRVSLLAGLAAAGLLAGDVLDAQIEAVERGVMPIDESNVLEVSGVEVDARGKNAEDARANGWREAQREGWAMLWARANNRPAAQAPKLADGALDAMVNSIVVEDERIGPTRYLARLGVLFDRSRAGALLGFGGPAQRSEPMLVIPVQVNGITPVSFETRTEWQRAWARFRTGTSAIDYVRTTGLGADPLLLNVAQARRPGRGRWRYLLDSYGAADVLVPEVHLQHLWPGGPILGRFVARYGPDGREVARFGLRVERGDLLPKLLDEGVRRVDAAYTAALAAGILVPDPSLVVPEPPIIELPEEEAEGEERQTVERAPVENSNFTYRTFLIQIADGDLGAALAAIRSVYGVSDVGGAGGVVSVRYGGDLSSLALALRARGYQVSEGGGGLTIRRPDGPAAAAPPPTADAPRAEEPEEERETRDERRARRREERRAEREERERARAERRARERQEREDLKRQLDEEDR
ncbi:MAG: hypothetical protein AVDCRST_MAG39-2751 [uncultured Sphingomonadaceae bacterium]|uniref:Heavy-metal-associated domain-containing protein n=1 Tax=uncultured Sphingomonadaceae bacterium TaxID=169976 RepID=A0A6J4TE24_9SPHN|nr:MAG: hypothetical protein AVDCRST_MAG39-2751 [uncultured Sphingomonadaceae bacterium]